MDSERLEELEKKAKILGMSLQELLADLEEANADPGFANLASGSSVKVVIVKGGNCGDITQQG